MAVAPTPSEIYEAAKREGEHRLSMPPLEKVSTGFIAGVTIVVGIIALGVVQALVEPLVGPEPAKIAGALALLSAWFSLSSGGPSCSRKTSSTPLPAPPRRAVPPRLSGWCVCGP